MIGVILSSKLIESTLRAQFGEILPVELPIQNKPLLIHQVESLSQYCEKIFITIPANYQITLPAGVNALELKENLSIIDVLNLVCEKFNEEDKIFINYGDSLFLNIREICTENNYFFLQKPAMQYGWGASHEIGFVPAGGVISSVGVLTDCLQGCRDFDSFALKIEERSDVLSFTDFEWLDFGHTQTYYHSRKRFLESRAFNELNHKDGFIVKSSRDFLKMWSEFNWLKECKEKAPINIPFVTDFNITKDKASYSIQYINHPALSDIFVFGKMNDEFFIKILESIKKTIEKIKKQSFLDKPVYSVNFLAGKLAEREDSILNIAKELLIDQRIIAETIKDNINYFKSVDFNLAPMHGDLCFSNILFDFSIFEPILIDPRGYISGKHGFSIYGPDIYDYYKLAHSYVIGYDYLIADKEDAIFFTKKSMLRRLNTFCELFDVEKENLKKGLINLFLSMIPLHMDSTKRQTAFFNIIKKIEEL